MKVLFLLFASILFSSPVVAFAENSPRQNNAVYKKALRDFQKRRYEEARLRLNTIVSFNGTGVSPISWGSPRQYPRDWQKAFILLGLIYEDGLGVEVNEGLARQLYGGALTPDMYKTIDWDRKSLDQPIFDFSHAPNAALGLCRIATTFGDVLVYCRAFEHQKNADSLNDPSGVENALAKLEQFRDTPEVNLRLARSLILFDRGAVNELLDSDVNPNFEFPSTEHSSRFVGFSRNTDMTTPLWYAAESRNVEMFEKLLEAGANPNLSPKRYKATTLLRQLWIRRDPFSGRRLAIDLLEPLLNNGYELDMTVVESLRGAAENERNIEDFYAFLPLLPEPLSTAARNVEDERRRAEERAATERELQHELALKAEIENKSQIGTRLCQKVRSFTYVGFVEASANGKVQIRMSYSVYTARPDFQGPDVRNQIVWDYPSNWTIC